MITMDENGKQSVRAGGIHCSYAALHTTKPKFYCTKTVGKIVPK